MDLLDQVNVKVALMLEPYKAYTEELDWFICLAAFLVGVGKGGVPGVHTVSVACFTFCNMAVSNFKRAIAINVMTNIICDTYVLFLRYNDVDWKLLIFFMPPLMVGMGIGYLLMGVLTDNNVRIFVGGMLLVVCAWNQYKERSDKRQMKAKKDGDDDTAPQTLPNWLLYVILLFGGVASVLANLMLPIMQLVMLSVDCSKEVFIATPRAVTLVSNIVKVGIHLHAGNLTKANMQGAGVVLMVIATLGVPFAIPIINRMNKRFHHQMTYVVLIISGSKLMYDGTFGVEPTRPAVFYRPATLTTGG